MHLLPETNLERVQRVVFSCDTEAGYKLRYLITRAQADPQFASKVDFSLHFNGQRAAGLINLFVFAHTVEGYDYWYKLYYYIAYGNNFGG